LQTVKRYSYAIFLIELNYNGITIADFIDHSAKIHSTGIMWKFRDGCRTAATEYSDVASNISMGTIWRRGTYDSPLCLTIPTGIRIVDRSAVATRSFDRRAKNKTRNSSPTAF